MIPMLSIDPFNPPFAKQPGDSINWGNLPGCNLGLAISNVLAHTNKTMLIVTADTRTASQIAFELLFFQQQHNDPILSFPDWETLPYDYFSPHRDLISDRLSTLYQLLSLKQGVVIASITTLMHKICPKEYIDSNLFMLGKGDKVNRDAIRRRLEKAGYHCVPQVTEHGEFAVRGSIIDLFPMGSTWPFRIDLLDDEIETIRTFSPETQRSITLVDKIELLPAKEFPLTEEAIEHFRHQWRSEFSGNPLNCPIYRDITDGIPTPGIEYYLPLFFTHTATVFDYLPEDSIIIQIGDLYAKSNEFWQDIRHRYEQRSHDITRPCLNPQHLFISTADFFKELKRYSNIKTTSEKIEPKPLFQNEDNALQELERFLATYEGRVLICAETVGRREVILQLLSRIHQHPTHFISWEAFLNDTASLGITVAALEDGLSLTKPMLTILTETQLFGNRVMQRRRRKETTQHTDAMIKNLIELEAGDPIVHADHGVGRYLGLQTLNVGEQLTEFLAIEYAGGDKLYVPVASLHLINRYSGTNPEHAPLDKLGNDHWQRAKRKAAEQIRDVAAELLEIYAKREARTGFTYQNPEAEYTAFANAFPFEETPDQLQAIDHVMADMQSTKPMDRLICGDVGFGKTEVAMRAAFIAVQNNKQVAVLVPTTLLAQQHFQNFQDRFADWPVRVEVISRFKTAKEQQKIIDTLADGKIDILIGTHKLLQQNILFKSFGLLIIDEEHRFGVGQKEKLKSLRHDIDILTLTATPIPRTLNMAFAGIRDFSIIATPPAKRLAVKTFVHEYQSQIIQEALSREILRGGQVYFLHNEVATIEKMAREITSLVPEARVSIAHGQMRERELEQIMADFYHRRFNVLVCSTIIESGIDIPSANTIIINRADKFGLAQLHQLRGRVGRSHHQAYAYLLIPSHTALSKDAEKRLSATAQLEELGIGFSLATHDLEIRGAGELLGEEQSGNMHTIGFTLYMDLLARAVRALKEGKEPELTLSISRGAEIDLQVPALIPETYLADVQLRLQCYKRIASANTATELDEIQVELIDRFGLLPEPTHNLFAIAALKHYADSLGILKIEANSKGGKIEFTDKPHIDPANLIQLIQTQSSHFKLEGPTRLRFQFDTHDRNQRIAMVEAILGKLAHSKGPR